MLRMCACLGYEVALVVACYLGSKGDNCQVQNVVAGVANVCSGAKKDVLGNLRKDSNMLKTTEVELALWVHV